MKRHWKKILIAFITVLIISGGYIAYIFQFKEYDVADTEVAEITKETYSLELPDGTVIELDEEGNIVEEDETAKETNIESQTASTSNNITNENGKDNSSISANNLNDSNTKSTSGGKNSSTKSTKKGDKISSSNSKASNTTSEKITVASIKEKYVPTMVSLQEQANGRINALVGRAMEEYQSKKANGESVNYAYFYNKYTSAAAELEGRTDNVFYQVVGIVEKELVANGYSKTHAESFVKEYETAKESRRSALIDKAINR
ncbi:MAG: hypothetical protein KKF57_10555 [Firmicutes bacterium]|nr:hypothetical protein [Bacillota bacterium]